MSNLKPLAWVETNHPNGVYFEKTDSYIKVAICFCSTLATDYVIRRGNDTGMYVVNYGGRTENEYHTLEEAKEWCEFTHYPSKMQPYVKPMPTWIDASERLPDKSGRYMVVHQTIKCVKNKPTLVDIDSYDENEKAWIFFRSGIMQEVTHWMPIPEFNTMQNLHKGGGCD